VENPVYPGTPDVNYIDGWLELKWARKWPSRATTPFRLDHFTQQQRVWLKRRADRGGNAHVLLQVGTDWMLFDAEAAFTHLGFATRTELVELAVWKDRGPSALPRLRAFLQALSR